MRSYAKTVQGGGLQMGCRPSKADNAAMPTDMASETGLDYIAQAILLLPFSEEIVSDV